MSTNRTAGFTMPSFDNFMNLPITNWEKFWNIAPKLDIDLFSNNSGDGEIEQRVVDKVGSYGRQLGQLTKVVEILVARTIKTETALDEVQRSHLAAFQKMTEHRKEALAAARRELNPSDKDRVIKFIKECRASHPEIFTEVKTVCEQPA